MDGHQPEARGDFEHCECEVQRKQDELDGAGAGRYDSGGEQSEQLHVLSECRCGSDDEIPEGRKRNSVYFGV
ncbi:hypothetical protein SDC9_42739 [bioreactor metagenome]|uniref:Uncharacterized protein n=1 Tax=bioreactor metagenome TaxID=1076179 RepID=A0A644VZ25_9ZZZZ